MQPSPFPSRRDAAPFPYQNPSNRQPSQYPSVSMTTADKTARRVYSAEQLHRLRASFSAPRLREAIEEHDGEDAELVKGVSSSCSYQTPPPPLPPPVPCPVSLRWRCRSTKQQRAWRRSTLSLLTPAAQHIIPKHDHHLVIPAHHVYSSTRTQFRVSPGLGSEDHSHTLTSKPKKH